MVDQGRPIRVLWLVKGLGPGGAEQLLLLSAKVADRERFDYRLAYRRPDKKHLVPEFAAAGLVPVRLGDGLRLDALWPLQLRSMLADADVVHAHSPVLASVARLLTRTLPRGRRPAVVTTEHNEWTSHRTPTRWLNGLTARVDAHRWAVSDEVRNTVWASRRGRTEVLIHGIDTEADPPEAGARAAVRASLGLGDGEVVAITVANLRKNKDYPNLLRAAKDAVARQPRLRFLAVGQGPLEAEIKALHAELGLGGAFQLLGFRRDIHDLMAAADLFVLGSAHEGLPIAMMEAFAAGLPVVATAVGGIPQAVRDGVEGRVVPPHDHHALADALVEVATDDALRARLGKAARERSHDYDIRTAVTEQERVYAKVARRG